MSSDENTSVAEEWRTIPGEDPRYEVSNLGRVRSWCDFMGGRTQSPRPLVGAPNSDGYPVVALPTKGRHRTRRLHRLVLLAFVGESPPGCEAAHRNGDRSDARLANLRWATRSENHRDKRTHGTCHRGEQGPGAKLTNAEAAEIRKRLADGEVGARLAEEYRVSQSAISRIRLGQTFAIEAALIAAAERVS